MKNLDRKTDPETLGKLNQIVELVYGSGIDTLHLSINMDVCSIDVYSIVEGKHVFNSHSYFEGDLIDHRSDDDYLLPVDELIIELKKYIEENGK